MNQYVTGAVIKELREKNKLTQAELAGKPSEFYKRLNLNIFFLVERQEQQRLSACSAIAISRFPLLLNPPTLEEVEALMRRTKI